LNPENGDLKERLKRHKAAANTKQRQLNEIESGLPGLQAATDKARDSLRTIETELMR
jgi:multidrug resistance efflux pump